MMKKSKSNLTFTTGGLIAFFFFAFLIAGCDKDACSGDACENGGICVDGTCDCPTGFTGQFCEDSILPTGRQVRTWINLDGQGNPITVGISIPEEMLINLPPLGQLTSIKLPTGASTTLFDHVFLGWVSSGHGPFWIIPHFDIHFMMVSETERESVTSGTEGGSPLADPYIPQDYVTHGSKEPRMGVHWWDRTSPEIIGGEFTATMIYGSYQGQITFIEPMISLAYLRSKPSVTFNIKQPAKYQKTGFWPTTYSIKFDVVLKEFAVTIEGFNRRTAG